MRHRQQFLRLAVVVGLVVTVVQIAAASPAGACSTSGPLKLETIVASDEAFSGTDVELTGIYETEHIAGAPNLLFRDARTVSVVTRYWGEPPAELGVVIHGKSWLLNTGDSCGNQSGETGWILHGYVTDQSGDLERPLVTVSVGPGGRLSADQVTLLEQRFGPGTELSISTGTKIAARLRLWWLPALLVLVVLAPLLTRIVRTLRRRLAIG